MKAVILAGGLGTRISEETDSKPKPMVSIGGYPILWHIMKIYSSYGVNDFIICCGYKGYVIKEYFANYSLYMSDVTIDMQKNKTHTLQNYSEPWSVTLIDTGTDTMTGGRLKRVETYLQEDEDFCFTYGDGVTDVDIGKVIAFHEKQNTLATVVASKPPGNFGAIDMAENLVTSFREKPDGDGNFINAGFFVLKPSVLDYISGDDTIWEKEPLERLAGEHQLSAYLHEGFWQCMDTLRDKTHLEALWELGRRALETVAMSKDFWNGKRVLITGHTGFKGSWLSLWLHELKAHVVGCALAPPPEKNLYTAAKIESLLESHYLDIRDGPALTALFDKTSPDIVFHLAAQPLVLASYEDPVGTYETNVIGTLNVLEAVRATSSVNAAVIVTTDKCYENREWQKPYRESDRLGGHDPYSSSKACTEILVASYRKSYFTKCRDGHRNVLIATARAGNVIGGGDWAPDRLLPDLMRAIERGEDIVLRNPKSVRPWQHVLESLAGYLLLAERLNQGQDGFDRGWNFGPNETDIRSVEWVAERIVELSDTSSALTGNSKTQAHEASILKLDSSDAKMYLGWEPRWNISETIQKVVDWYGYERDGGDAQRLCRDQIREYHG